MIAYSINTNAAGVLRLALACGCVMLAPVARAETPVAAETPRVLIYTRNFTTSGKGFVHDNIAASAAAVAELCQEKGIASDISERPEDITMANLGRYKAVVFCNSNNEAFTGPAQSKALVDFVQAGGGFVGIHSASGSERKNPEFKKLLGGVFLWHTPLQPFDVHVADKSHPSAAHLPNPWKVEDEGYLCDMEKGLHIVLEMETQSVARPPRATWKMKFEGDRFPLAWCQEIGKGRSYYTALGHKKSDYAEPVFRKHLQGAILWSMRMAE